MRCHRAVALLAILGGLPGLGQVELQILPIELCTAPESRTWPTPPPGLRPSPAARGAVSYVVGEGSEARLVQRRPGSPDEETLLTAAELRAWLEALGVADPGELAALAWRGRGRLGLAHAGRLVELDLEARRARILQSWPEAAALALPSPDGSAVAYVHGYDVHIAGADGLHVAATRGGHEDLRHGVEVSRVEFGIHDGLWWAPDSRRVAFYREDFRPILPYPYVDHRPRPAVLVPGRYPMAGQNQSRVSIGVHTLASRETVWLATDPEAGEFLTNVAWTPDGEELWVVHVNRAQDREELWVYSAATGERRRRVLVEEDPRWQEPESPVHFVPGGLGSFLRFSWRTGFRHLDLHEASGERTRACTGGRFDLLAFSSFLPNGSGDFLVEGTGEDPRDRRLFRASLAGGLVDLTPEPGAHETELAPSSDWFLDRHTSLEIPLRVLARSAVDGSILAVLFEVEDPLSDFVAPRPEPFTTTTADGQPMHGFLLRPHGVAKGSRAPVIHYVYGGPKAQLVQNAWRGGKNRWNLWLAHLAARGYAVVLADGRGSAHRGIAWAQAVHRRLGDLEVEDQLRALDAALGLLPGDPDRVGVTGWSYGGYLSLCLATRGGSRYRAAAAGAPVTDWAFYETGYGERYMDRPEENPDGYRRARPAEHLDGLRARLLLVHGTADDTVVLQHSMDFLSACVRKGVLVDFLAYPGEKHAFRREALAHVLRLFTDHFDRNLPGP